MARVTVEDCIVHIPNRFELVLLAGQRAKQIASGNPLTVDRDNDKDAVVSLREIADLTVSLEGLNEDTINSFCKRQQADIADSKAVEEDEMHMQVEQEFTAVAQTDDEAAEELEDDEAGMSFSDENVDPED